MKIYVEACELKLPVPGKLMQIENQEAEVLPGALFFPALSLIVPLSNVKYAKTGTKPVPKPPPAPTSEPKKETGRAKAKKSAPKKPAKSKSAVRTSKKVRNK